MCYPFILLQWLRKTTENLAENWNENLPNAVYSITSRPTCLVFMKFNVRPIWWSVNISPVSFIINATSDYTHFVLLKHSTNMVVYTKMNLKCELIFCEQFYIDTNKITLSISTTSLNWITWWAIMSLSKYLLYSLIWNCGHWCSAYCNYF
jgi:hypothetical protein